MNDLQPKPPPHDMTAERSVLGCCLLDHRAKTVIQSMIVNTDFFHPPHAIIYDAINTISDDGGIPDYVTLTNKLMDGDNLEAAGGGEYIAGLTNVVASVRNAEHYAEIVLNDSCRRQMIRLGNELAKCALNDGSMTPAALESMALSRLTAIGRSGNVEKAMSLSETNAESILYAHQVVAGKRAAVLDLGFKSLSEKCGLEPGDSCIIGGYPSTGKTTLAVNFSRNVAWSGGQVLFLSLEMNIRQIDHKFSSLITRIPHRLFKYGAFYADGELTDRFNEYRETLKKMGQRIWIKHIPYSTVEDVRRIIKYEMLEHPQICLVVVDYMQLLGVESRRNASPNERISIISRNMKLMACESEVPIITLSQFSRKDNRDPTRPPKLSDFRDSGAIEQDADVAILLHNTMQNQKDDAHLAENEHEIQLIIAKGRTEGTSVADFVMVRDIGLFTDNPEAL